MRRQCSALFALLFAAPLAAQLPAADHAAKRQSVVAAMPDNSILFVEGAGTPPREDQAFMQSRDFQALTGIMQPGSALVLWKKNGVVGQRIVVPEKPAYAWQGDQIGPMDATALTGLPATAIPLTSAPGTGLEALLDSIGARNTRVFFDGQDTGWPGLSRQLLAFVGDSGVVRPAPRAAGAAGRAAAPPAMPGNDPTTQLRAITNAINQARARKTDAEIALLKKAAEISVEGHKAAMRMLYPGVKEAEIRGAFEGKIFALGAERVGYPSIVGAGANATYLHYSADTMQSKAGDVVVMDAAAIWKGYSADVTRTFPVSGRFSPEQRIIYEAVLAAQNAAAAVTKPGATAQMTNAAATAELWKGIVKAGLADSVGATYMAPGRNGDMVPQPQLNLFYFHGLSHGLGLNVHDPTFTDAGKFVKNTIFTIEPGLYVRPMTLDMIPDVPENAAYRARVANAMKKYSGTGTRIEDDFVVTDTGNVCLSCGAPRTIAEVEALAGKGAARPKVAPRK